MTKLLTFQITSTLITFTSYIFRAVQIFITSIFINIPENCLFFAIEKNPCKNNTTKKLEAPKKRIRATWIHKWLDFLECVKRDTLFFSIRQQWNGLERCETTSISPRKGKVWYLNAISSERKSGVAVESTCVGL